MDLLQRLPLHHLLPWLLILRMRLMMKVMTMMLDDDDGDASSTDEVFT